MPIGPNVTAPSTATAANFPTAQSSLARVAFAQAVLLFQERKFEETTAVLNRAIAADPKLAAAYQLGGLSRVQKNQRAEAPL